jgi:hypothetical protein
LKITVAWDGVKPRHFFEITKAFSKKADKAGHMVSEIRTWQTCLTLHKVVV